MNYLEIYPELKNIEWLDLVRPGLARVITEIALPLPFLGATIAFLSQGLIIPAIATAFFFFLAGLRLSHNAQHYIIGCRKAICDWVMFGLSVLMMNSMHAVQVTHLHHHKHCLTEYDVEGHCASMPFWQAIIYGPLFTIYMHKNAWILGNKKQRKWIAAEVTTEILTIALCFWSGIFYLEIFILLMLLANCLTGFFCVWLVHYGCDGLQKVSRTMRNKWVNVVTMNMLLHVEHHLFPQVPTYNLGKLATRIDKQTSNFKENLVF